MTSADEIRTTVLEALSILRGRDKPEDVLALARRIAALPDDALQGADLDALLENALPADPIVIALGEVVSKLDTAAGDNTDWVTRTEPYSVERRQVSCLALGLPPKSIEAFTKLRPVMHLGRPTVISEKFTRSVHAGPRGRA